MNTKDIKRNLLLFYLICICCIIFAPTAYAADKVIEGGISANLKPYIYRNAEEVSEATMTGVVYKDAIVFSMGYNPGYDAEVDYNFKGNYSLMSFDTGFYNGSQKDCKLTIVADGVTIVDEDELSFKNVAKNYKINLTGVSHLSIQYHAGGYDIGRYAIGNIVMTPAKALTEEKSLESNMFYNCEPYQYTNASPVTKEFSMGGYTYTEGINLSMGYTGTSTGGTSRVMFNFQNHYRSMNFDFARCGGNYYRDVKLTIIADGKTLIDKQVVPWNTISKKYSIDLNGVSQLEVFTESEGYDKVFYNLGNIQLVSDGILRGIIFKKTSGSVSADSPEFVTEPVIVPIDATSKNYTLKSDEPIVAMVDEKGVVRGRHKGTAIITATTETGGFTAECKISSSLPEARFIPSVDGWGFGNQTLDIIKEKENLKGLYKRVADEYLLYPLTDGTLNEMPSGANALWYWILGIGSSGGTCFGNAVSAALTKTESIPFNTWEWSSIKDNIPKNPGEIKTLKDTDPFSNSIQLNLKQFIYTCFLAQGSKSVIANEFSHNINTSENLVKAVRNYQDTGKNPIVVKLIRKPTVLFGNTVSHEVLAYEVDETDNEIYVYVYDSNYNVDSNKATDGMRIVMKKDAKGNITEWSYPDFSSNGGELHYNDSIGQIGDRIKTAGKLDMVKKVLQVTSKTHKIKSNGKQVIESVNGNVTGDSTQTEIIPINLAGGTDSGFNSHHLYAVDTDDIEVILGGTKTDKETVRFFDEKSASIIDSNGGAVIDKTTKDNKIDITIKNNADTFGIRHNYSEDDSTVITGNANGEIDADIDENTSDIIIKGCSELKVVVIKDGKQIAASKQLITTPTENYTIKTDGQIIGKLPSQTPVKVNALKKITIKSVKAKKKTKKITGKLSVAKATVKIKVGKAAYKKAKVSKKSFTLKTKKLKKGTKIVIKVSKKGYKTTTKKIKVK